MNTAAAMATGGRSSVFLTVAPPPSQKLQTLSPKQVSFTNNKWSTLPLSHGNSLLEFNSFLCSSSSSTPVVEEKENGSSDDVLPSSINQESTSVLPPGYAQFFCFFKIHFLKITPIRVPILRRGSSENSLSISMR